MKVRKMLRCTVGLWGMLEFAVREYTHN